MKSTPSISVAVLTLAIAISIGVWVGYFGRPGFPHPPRIVGDTAPFVKSQVFGAVPLWIEIGYQPLVIPAAHLIEVMRRDLILASYMESNRVRLRFVQFTEGGSCIQAFDKGLDGAVLSGIGAVRLAVRHDAHIVSRFQGGYVSIICRGARTLDDLKGRRVGYKLGDGVLQALRSLFRKAGIDPSEVAFVELNDTDPTRGLLQGRADAIGAFEPIPTIAARNFPELAVLGQEEVSEYLLLSREVVTQHPQVAHEILASAIRAFFWLKATRKNLHQAGLWVRQEEERVLFPGLSIDVFDYDRLATRTIVDLEAFVGILRPDPGQAEGLRAHFEFAVEQGLVPKDTSYDRIRSLVHRELVEHVMRDSDEHRLRVFRVARHPF